jgi:DNA-directed RNA polymerase subunit RPC12/RpoP
MGRKPRKLTKKLRKNLVCPSCQTPLAISAAKDELIVCPHCSDWMVMHGNLCQRVELFEEDFELDTDEEHALERSLTSRIS